ncbi:MAG: GUN4 domain-containing protein, partial [Crocosphaera sp.]
QTPYDRRRQNKINDFIQCFRDWKSKRPNPDAQYQQQIKELEDKIQENEKLYQDKLTEITEIKNNYQAQKQELEKKEYSLQQLQQTKNNDLEKLEQNYNAQKEQLEESLTSQINQLQQQLLTADKSSSELKVQLKSYQQQLSEKESIINQLQQKIQQLQSSVQNPDTQNIELKELKDKIELKSEKGVDYTKLRDLLAAGEWKEADKETANVMLQAANLVSEGWFRESDIDNLPCDDLRTIDKLWVHYSKGKFGFSVQKKIYMDELGGTRYYNEKIWYEFCDRVGWRKGGSYVNYSDLTFELHDTTPVGHLPLGNTDYITVAALFSRAPVALFSRAKICKL